MNARDVAVVTGATGGMGRVIALALAERGMHVVTVARDPARADALRTDVAATSGAGSLEVVAGDLSNRDGVVAAAAAIRASHGAVHVLVNNAGAHYPEHRLSADGLELHIAVDYLAAYGLTTLLEAELRRGRARVVNLASDTLRDTRQLKLWGKPRPVSLDVDQLDDLGRLNPAGGFVPFEAYARAKLLAVVATYGLATRFAGDVTVNAVHPGIVSTGIIDELIPPALKPFGPLIRRGMLSPAEGASAALRLAIDPAPDETTGRYFVREVETAAPPVVSDRGIQRRLCDTSDRFFAGGFRYAR